MGRDKWKKIQRDTVESTVFKKSTVTKAKNEGLRANVDGKEIILDNTESLLNG